MYPSLPHLSQGAIFDDACLKGLNGFPDVVECSFVQSTVTELPFFASKDEEKIERLEITGIGDPFGLGLGFIYVRVTPKASISNAMVKKKTVIGKGSTVTGTDADLRTLSMEAAKEVVLLHPYVCMTMI
ncbi:unnamed protein product [Fraxinus pennsylvanica]|uniref:Uncharacterized protein n=1 Tax=Fraxinus pennsylvanica TaxID=56036 RepID=A0AAD2A1U2_9LAMI|nr:unnamed protein product [Fraxinus pennsylvanica]